MKGELIAGPFALSPGEAGDKRIGIFLIGILLGIWLFARVINILLKKFPKETFYFILGLVVASLYAIFPEIPPTISGKVIGLLIILFAGFISLKLGERNS